MVMEDNGLGWDGQLKCSCGWWWTFDKSLSQWWHHIPSRPFIFKHFDKPEANRQNLIENSDSVWYAGRHIGKPTPMNQCTCVCVLWSERNESSSKYRVFMASIGPATFYSFQYFRRGTQKMGFSFRWDRANNMTIFGCGMGCGIDQHGVLDTTVPHSHNK